MLEFRDPDRSLLSNIHKGLQALPKSMTAHLKSFRRLILQICKYANQKKGQALNRGTLLA